MGVIIKTMRNRELNPFSKFAKFLNVIIIAFDVVL
jgi:hypothetical protein